MKLKMSEDKKEDIITRLEIIPKRKLSDIEKQLIFILVERSKVKREKSILIINQIFLVFIAFVVLTYLSKENNFISGVYVNILLVVAIIFLILSVVSYQSVINKEEKTLVNLFNLFLK